MDIALLVLRVVVGLYVAAHGAQKLFGWVAASSLPLTKTASRRLTEWNGEFHRYINRLSSGNRIRWFIRQTVQFIPDDLYRTVPGWLEGSLNDHPKIIDALEAGDRPRARKLMESHLAQGAELIGRSLKHPLFSEGLDGSPA